MKSCFGYVRVSTAKQGEGVSLEAQREAIELFAAKNGITITQWFEETQTAAKGGRPVFTTMLRLLRQRHAAGVVIHKIDRSARNFADWAKIGELADAGVDVHFATESLDFRSRGGRLSADLQAVIAADYIRNLREETKKGITGRLKQGLYPFGAPLGYLNNGGGKAKTLDPERAPLIAELFDLYASGQHSIRSLLAHSRERGLRNRNGKPLAKTSIEQILNNPFYCGVICIGTTGETYEGTHQPLISVATFERVQAIKAGKAGKKITRHNHVYRGLFRCAQCDGAMIPERQKGHVYYRCQTKDCPMKCVREERIETAIQDVLARVQLSDADVARLTEEARTWLEEQGEDTSAKAAELQLAQVSARLNRLTDALIDRLIDQEEYQRRKETLVLERKRLEEQLHSDDAEPTADDLREFLELVKSLAATYEIAKPAQKRQILQWATSNRTIAPTYICVRPSNWLQTTAEAIGVLDGALQRDTTRSLSKLIDAQKESFKIISK